MGREEGDKKKIYASTYFPLYLESDDGDQCPTMGQQWLVVIQG